MAARVYGTLVANTVTTEEITGNFETILVHNLATAALYATVNGVTPTVQGDDTFVVPGNTTRAIEARDDSPTVKLISTGANDYGVEGWDA